MFRSLCTLHTIGNPTDERVILKPPVAITSVLDADEAAELPDVELAIHQEDIFSVTVGPPAKKTLAGWHVTCPEEVVEALEYLLDSAPPPNGA